TVARKQTRRVVLKILLEIAAWIGRVPPRASRHKTNSEIPRASQCNKRCRMRRKLRDLPCGRESIPEIACPVILQCSSIPRSSGGTLGLCGARSLPSNGGCFLYRCSSPGANASQQPARRFVIGVLGHQLALEGALQDGLAQPLGPLQVGLNLHFKLVNHRETALDLSEDAVLLGQRRQWQGK